ncbi:MAG: two-component system sensor histidine kinase NtrB [Syntrophobacteraceae bacterium]
MEKRTQKHCSTLRIPRRDWKSYTLDDIEEVIAFYLGVKTASEPKQDILTEKANKEVDFSQPDLAIFSVTLEGKFIDISRAGVTILGYASKEEILENGETRALFFNKRDVQKLKEIIERQGYVKDCEVLLKRKSGELLNILVTGTALHDETGKLFAYRGIIRDITSQKKLEEFNQAMETIVAERTMSLMAMSLADKVRNPATVVAWLSKRMMDTELPDDLKESLLGIKTEAGKLEAIVSEFQSMLGDRRSVFIYEDVNKALRSIIPLIEKEVDQRGIKLFSHVSEKPLRINLQRDLWRVALLQVARNAIEATPSGGEVTIRTYAESDHVIISVSDTGQGIPEDEIEKIFDPFITTKTHRYGMGLPLVKQVVSEHMGTIHIESKKGKGTTFRMVFPARWR